jgi:hypothetical protein
VRFQFEPHSAEQMVCRGYEINRLLRIAIVAVMLAGLLRPEQAGAIDLSGAWATSADECPNVFVRKGRARQIEFTALSDQHGGGFIAEAGRLRGEFARCKIKTKKEDGDTVNIIAGCATDIMLSTPVRPQDARAEQDIADVSGHRGYGDQLLRLSDLIALTSRPGAGAR